ncbi:MAG: chemotaxis protein CheW [Acidothermus sp.]|nr:chemotaxis protein CheW [Acidothermus sp.]
MSGYVTFQLGAHAMACPLEDVREVVRLVAPRDLPGLDAPVSGVIELRGVPLPLVDVREARGGRGDVLVVQTEHLGVVVDRVTAVLGPDELSTCEIPRDRLPGYVRGALQRSSDGAPVLLVDLRTLAEAGYRADETCPSLPSPPTTTG